VRVACVNSCHNYGSITEHNYYNHNGNVGIYCCKVPWVGSMYLSYRQSHVHFGWPWPYPCPTSSWTNNHFVLDLGAHSFKEKVGIRIRFHCTCVTSNWSLEAVVGKFT